MFNNKKRKEEQKRLLELEKQVMEQKIAELKAEIGDNPYYIEYDIEHKYSFKNGLEVREPFKAYHLMKKEVHVWGNKPSIEYPCIATYRSEAKAKDAIKHLLKNKEQ